MEHYYRFFLAGYDSANLETRKKTKILLIINSIICIVILFNALAIEIPVNHDFLSALMELLLALLLSSSLVFLKTGRYAFSSNLSITILLAGFTGLGFVNPLGTEEFKIMQLGFMLSMITIYACLIGHKQYQMILGTSVSGAVIIIFFITRFFSGNNTMSTNDKTGILMLILIILAISGVMCFLIMKVSKEIIGLGEDEAAKNREEAAKLQSLLDSFKNSMAFGEKLILSSEKTTVLTNDAGNCLSRIQSDSTKLNTEIQFNVNTNKTIVQSASEVRQSISRQNEAVSETSGSLEEMNRTIKNISDTAQKKKTMISQLIETTKKGAKEMGLVRESIGKITESAKKMMEINRIILDVSDKTNILAMNASIESAHAGKLGRGFAIVAEEIRKLADETKLNTKMITEVLKINLQDLDKANSLNAGSAEAFVQITQKVDETAGAMDEIMEGLSEINAAAELILKSVEKMLPLSASIEDAVRNVDNLIHEENQSNNRISAFSEELKESISGITKAFQSVSEEMKQIDAIGKKNQENIANLEKEIRQIIMI